MKKIVTIITEDDVIKKDQKGKEKNKEIEFDAKEKGGGGGRGAREAKTKGKGKKNYKKPYGVKLDNESFGVMLPIK